MAVWRADYKLGGKAVTLRNAEPDDAPELIALVNAFDGESTFLSREPGEFDMTEEKERAFLLECKENPDALYLVAEAGGRIVGTTNAQRMDRRRYRHVAGLGLAVAKAHWGTGIGKALLTELLGFARENGVEKVELQVDTTNHRAIALYMSLGFTVEGTRRRDRKMADGTYRDGYWMGVFL